VYVPVQLLSLGWASSAVSNIRRSWAQTYAVLPQPMHAWLWFELVGRARQGAARVANGRTYPYLRGDLGQAARGGLGGGGRLGGSEGRLSGGAEACLTCVSCISKGTVA